MKIKFGVAEFFPPGILIGSIYYIGITIFLSNFIPFEDNLIFKIKKFYIIIFKQLIYFFIAFLGIRLVITIGIYFFYVMILFQVFKDLLGFPVKHRDRTLIFILQCLSHILKSFKNKTYPGIILRQGIQDFGIKYENRHHRKIILQSCPKTCIIIKS